jgi:hypothetical protein
VVFLDGQRYRGRVDALSVIEELRGQVADSWFVFVSEESPGHAVRYKEFDGDHEYACWNRTLVDALKWGVPLEPAE